MPRELITVQVGQCGIQLGTRFWDLALREHGSHSKDLVFDEPLSSFFRNVDTRGKQYKEIPVGDGTERIRSLKARAVLVDMEEGVLSEVMRSPLGELFDSQQFIKDVSGSGNNWATGHCVYGPQYRDSVLDGVRRAAEACDSLQSFFFMHSLGGGTGSGLGTYILRSLADDYPEVYRFTSAIFPSPADDVITSPYNSVLSLAQLQQYSDCVLPLENQALMNICQRISPTRLSNMRGAARGTGAVPGHSNPIARDVLDRQGARGSSSSRDAGFDDMNTVAAHVLTNLTCGMRFPGSLNVDLNEITMNLVPFPSLHFLVPSVAPLLPLSVLESFGPAAPAASAGRRSMNSGAGVLLPRSIDSTFSDVITPEFQLLTCAPKQHTYLACGLLARGEVEISDMNRNVTRLKALLRMPSWNSDGFKVGLCSVAPVGLPCSVLGLANNSCMATVFSDMLTRFQRLFRRRAHLHHYTEHMELSEVQSCADIVIDLATGYAALGLGHLDRVSAGGAGTKAGHGAAASRAGLAQPRSSAEDSRDPRGVRTMRVTAAAAGASSGARQEAITRPSAGQPVRTQGVRTRARDGVAAPAGRGQSAGRASFTVLKRSGLFKALDSVNAGQADPRLAMSTDARHAVTVHDSRVDSSRRSGSRPVLDPHDAPDDMLAPATGSSEQLGSSLLDMYLALHTSPPTEPDAREVTDQKSDVE